MMRAMRRLARTLIVLLFVLPLAAAGEETYLTPDDFVASVFDGTPPKPSVLWLSGDIEKGAREILGHPYRALRVRYWRDGNLTAWILEEIGKTLPITAGFAVEDGHIKRAEVLIYRESHGWEVRYPFFTDQFHDARLTPQLDLTQRIDNISGATLSVNALTRLARLALFLHEHAVADGQ